MKKTIHRFVFIFFIAVYSTQLWSIKLPGQLKNLTHGMTFVNSKLELAIPKINKGGYTWIGIKNIKLDKGAKIRLLIFYAENQEKPIATFLYPETYLTKKFIFVNIPRTVNIRAYAILTNNEVLTARGTAKVVKADANIESWQDFSAQPITTHPRLSKKFIETGKKEFESYSKIDNNKFIETGKNRTSTFSIDVDTGSYTNIRRYIVNNGTLPPKDAVRIEEMLNYFQYEYEPPKTTKVPFKVSLDGGPTPWNSKTRLLKIGIKGYEIDIKKRPAANLVFLIDVSGSMARMNKLGLLTAGLKMLTRQLNKNDRVAIVVYASRTGVLLPPTPGDQKQKIISVLNSLSASGKTRAGAGITLAYDIAEKSFIKGGINRVILATDGDFNLGITNTDQLVKLIEKKRKTGVYLTTLGFGTNNYKEDKMEKLANHGNGNYAYIDTIREARKVLVRQMTSTLATIANDVKIQVTFNKKFIRRYRLIGYVNRKLENKDFKNDKVDAGEIGSGHTVTALYELDINPGTGDTAELAQLKIRYKKTNNAKSQLISYRVSSKHIKENIAQTKQSFRFAVSVAAFGQYLRKNKVIGDFNLEKIQALAKTALGKDQFGDRKEFVDILWLARSLE